MKTIILNCNNISKQYYFYCICDQINAAWTSLKKWYLKPLNKQAPVNTSDFLNNTLLLQIKHHFIGKTLQVS